MLTKYHTNQPSFQNNTFTLHENILNYDNEPSRTDILTRNKQTNHEMQINNSNALSLQHNNQYAIAW